MSGGFDPPQGDPAVLAAAAAKLQAVAKDLGAQEATLKGGFSTALAEWHGQRADDFRLASGGIQVETVSAGVAAGQAGDALAKYAVALSAARSSIAGLSGQATAAGSDADTDARRLPPDSPQVDVIYQHAARRIGDLARRAQAIHDDLDQLAIATARLVDAATDAGLPGASSLDPAEIGRRVDSAFGVTGLGDAARNATLTPDQAWGLLDPARKAAPPEDVEADGEPDWKKIIDGLDLPVNGPVSAWAVGTAPPAGWALYQLANNARVVQATTASVLQAADAIVGRVQPGNAESIIKSAYDLENLGSAAAAFDPAADTPGLVDAAKTGGIPDAGAWGVAGRVFAVAGIASDVMTVWAPPGDSTTERRVNQGAAVLNGAATITVLAAANASADWIPVVGEVVMVATGLYLAGDWIYNSYKHGGWARTAADATGNFVTHTAPHAIASGAKSAWHWAFG